VDLQTLFSDIAPVRSAFVVTEPGTGISKGVGYVSFALKEDAASAFAGLEKDGIELVGRKLRVQWAENKACRLYFCNVQLFMINLAQGRTGQGCRKKRIKISSTSSGIATSTST